MPERQSTPGEVTPRPEADATENGNGTGADQGTRAGGNAQPAEPAEATTSGEAGSSERTGDTRAGPQRRRGERRGCDRRFRGERERRRDSTTMTTAHVAGQNGEQAAPGAGGSRPTGDAPNGSPGAPVNGAANPR